MADRTIPNPERGCGHLERGKAYVRGVIGSPDGILPSFVKTDPVVPYREVGTDGGFTRGFLELDGLSSQLALEDITDFVRLYPGDATDQQAVQNMVDKGLYLNEDVVPDVESQRHIDRIRARGTEGVEHFGGIDAVRQSDLLMRVGKTHYPEPGDFIQEAVEHGISKAIPLSKRQEPPVIQPGVTRMWLVHPEADDTGEDVAFGVIGYAYLQEVVFTEPADGQVPQYVQEWSDSGRLDVVDIEPPQEDTPDTSLDDFDSKPADAAADAVDADGGQDTFEGDEDDSDDAGDDSALLVPDPTSNGQDVMALQDVDLDADGWSYNDLKQMAAADGVPDVGQAPSRAELLDALREAQN